MARTPVVRSDDRPVPSDDVARRRRRASHRAPYRIRTALSLPDVEFIVQAAERFRCPRPPIEIPERVAEIVLHQGSIKLLDQPDHVQLHVDLDGVLATQNDDLVAGGLITDAADNVAQLTEDDVIVSMRLEQLDQLTTQHL